MENAVLASERKRAQEILRILRRTLAIREEDFATLTVAKESRDVFRTLVVTILTQNCTDVAALRAYRSLDSQVGVTVSQLANANTRTIGNAIRVAGLYKQKARGLRKLAKVLSERHNERIEESLKGPVETARVRLQELPRVGPKTADVILGVWGRPTLSVDTHVNRVSKRLGLAPRKAGIEKVRTALMRLFPRKDRRLVPLYFMAHGRKTCKARKPLCYECPVERLCPYISKTK